MTTFNLFFYVKRIFPNYLIKKRLKLAEYLQDIFHFIETISIFKERLFCPFRRFLIPTNSDFGLVFFLGVGDAIYGFPAFLEIKKIIKASGHNFHAFIEGSRSNTSNPAVYDLLKSSGIFDRVTIFYGKKTNYWKYYDWTSIQHVKSLKILPFIFNINSSVENRVVEVFKQYSLPIKINWPVFPSTNPFLITELSKLIDSEGGFNIFIHLESRSQNYKYGNINELIDIIVCSSIFENKLNLIILSTNLINIKLKVEGMETQCSESFQCITFPTGNKLIIVNPEKFSISEQILLIKEKCDLILSINSYLWPISNMLNINLIGLHSVDSPDGHQFAHEKSFFISSSIPTYKKLRNSIFAVEGLDYRRLPSNPLIVEYFPETIYRALSHRLQLISDLRL